MHATPVQDFGDYSKWTNFNRYYRHSHVPEHRPLSSKVQVFVDLFVFFYVHSMVGRDDKIHEFRSIIIIIIIIAFHWCLINSTSKNFKTLLSILATYNNAIVWILLILPLISSLRNKIYKE